MRTPPIYIEVILHCYYSPEPIPREEAPAVQDAIAGFLRAGMIEQVDPGRYGSKYRMTARGKAWVEMICATPYPEQVRRNPVTSEADANLGTQGSRIAELMKELQLSWDGFIQACAGGMPAMAQRIRELEASLDSVQGTAALRHNKLRALGYEGPPIMSDKPYSEMMREANIR